MQLGAEAETGRRGARYGPRAVSELDPVVAYYERSWFDYRFLWMNPDNRAIHFGYWGPGVSSTPNRWWP